MKEILGKCNTFFKEYGHTIEFVFRFLELCIVGGVGIYLAFIANNISERSYELSYIETQPKFSVSSSLVDYDDDGILDTDYLVINYVDGDYSNISIEKRVFLNYRVKNEIDDKSIMINGYYYANEHHSDVEEPLLQLSFCVNNWDWYVTLDQGASWENDGLMITRLDKYVRISYTDILGERRYQYYKSTVGPYDRISEEEAKQYFELDYQDGVEFDDCTIEYLKTLAE